MEGLKNVFDMFQLFCNAQQESSCDNCPAKHLCEPQSYEKARKELNDNGHDV